MKNFLNYLLVFTIVSIMTISCQEEEIESPGPISIENIITPSILNDGDTGLWEIKVTSLGGELIINEISVHEEFISGWATGMGTVDAFLPVSNVTVPAHSTKTVYSKNIQVSNTGNTDVQAQNSIIVNSNGGSASKTVVYTIKMSSSGKSSKVKAKTLLLDKMSN